MTWIEHKELFENEVLKRLGMLPRNGKSLTIQRAKCVLWHTKIQLKHVYADVQFAWGTMSQCVGFRIGFRIVVKVIETDYLPSKVAKNQSSWVYFNLAYFDNYFSRKHVNTHNLNTRNKRNLVLPKVNSEIGWKHLYFRGKRLHSELK